MLRERYEDDEDDLAHLAMRLKEEPFFAGADVFVDSFFSLTPVENEIMYHIFRQAENVCVTFACPAKDTGEAQFASPRSFLAAMRRAADRAHREITVTELAENRRAAAPELAYLEENLWKFDAPAYEGDVSAIRVIKAADRYAEADAAVCRVEELIRGGARYADIALIARDAGHLRGILDTALERAGIPCFFSENADVDEVIRAGGRSIHITGGQMLHAGVLGFIHPRTGEYMEFTSELPDGFSAVLSALRGQEL